MDINAGRVCAAHGFMRVIDYFLGRSNVTELDLTKAWREEMSGCGSMLTLNGWYSPPPFGMALLSADDTDFSRSMFLSFRDPICFATKKVINWNNGLLLAYSSNIDTVTGLPSDFATTIYFGKNKAVIDLFRRSLQCCGDVLSSVHKFRDAGALYGYAERILFSRGLNGATWSSTDNGYNFGHTLPILDCSKQDNISLERWIAQGASEKLRRSRLFVSEKSRWNLWENGQFTFEPQCVSRSSNFLPKLMFHYVLQPSREGMEICRACESPISRFMDL